MEVIPTGPAALDSEVAPWLRSLRRRGVAVLESPSTTAPLRVDVRPAGFVKPFTGVSDEFFLTAFEGCPFQCTYCYLRSYLASLVPTYYANREVLGRELDALGEATRGRTIRVHGAHRGEVVPFEDLTGLVGFAADRLAPHPGITMEVRTKSDRTDHIVRLATRRNLVFSWTLSGRRQAFAFEKGAPEPAARVAALARMAGAGARVAVRLDPVVVLPGWERGCEDVLEQLRDTGAAVEDFHVGVLRFPASARRRFEETAQGRALLRGELLPGPDGKVRLSAPERFQVLRRIVSLIRRHFGSVATIRVCMEPAWLAAKVLAR